MPTGSEEREVPSPRVTRLRWPDPRVVDALSATVHDLNLAQVLQMAERLGWLPPRVELWAIEVDPSRAKGLPADEIPRVSQEIAADLLELCVGVQNEFAIAVAPPNSRSLPAISTGKLTDADQDAGQGDA